MTSRPTLTVYCKSGLSNRLRVLLSGMVLAEITGRKFQMLWPRTNACSAAFSELFSGDWPVTDVDSLESVLQDPEYASGISGTIEQFITDTRQDIQIGSCHWIFDCGKKSAPRMYNRCCRLLDKLEPIPEIRNRIEDIRLKHFRPVMIGVHLRRGDFFQKRPDIAWNTNPSFAAIDHFLLKNPEAGILLCTDDGAVITRTGQLRTEGIHDKFQKRYGDRVVTTSSRCLDRRITESIQDAVLDLWLLRATNMIVGTQGSSFSFMTIMGRNVEYFWALGKSPAYTLVHWITMPTGIQWLVRQIHRMQSGRNRPFPVAWRQLVDLIKKTALFWK